VHDGIVAANFLPFGTLVKIPELFGDKVFTVEDRMNQKYSHRVDVWMPTVDNAVNFGIHRVTIVVLGAGDAEEATK
jgi:3D (Asp-Asp-Asp) domain-containing protein